MADIEIGVLACSGEECLGGTLSRLATRKMMAKYPDIVVTLCLPLYVAGGEEEREFARDYPVIAVDGCDKNCAKKATEKFSGPVKAHIKVAGIIGEETALLPIVSGKDLTEEHDEMIDRIAQEIERLMENMKNIENC